MNWAIVDTARVSFLASENYALLAGASGDGPPAELARRSALVSYYGRGDNDAARAAWATQIEPARDPAEAVRWVDEGIGAAAFFLDQPDLRQVLKLAREGKTLPQKATYFHPKPPSGMVFDRLERDRRL